MRCHAKTRESNPFVSLVGDVWGKFRKQAGNCPLKMANLIKDQTPGHDLFASSSVEVPCLAYHMELPDLQSHSTNCLLIAE